jgi:ubiquinone/menaquinone biosynthesis C-methylase UbiE
MMPAGARVLDVGCGPGNLARMLVGSAKSIVGVDRDRNSLELARPFCSAVYLVDLESDGFETALEGQEFDAIIFADVLEHLRNADALLSSAKKYLAPGGIVFASIPNIAHGAIRLALLRGEFTYQKLGILDDTHVKFYTRASIESLFVRSGYEIEKTVRTTAPIFSESDLVPLVRRDDFPEAIAREVEADPDSTTLQVIVKAHPIEGPVHERLTAQKFLDLSQSLRTSEARYAQLERGSKEQAVAYGAQIAELTAQLQEARTLPAVLELSVQERDVAVRRIRALEATIESMEESLRSANEVVEASRERASAREAEIAALTDRVFALQASHASALSSLAQARSRLETARIRSSRVAESERALDERTENLMVALSDARALRERLARIGSLHAHATRAYAQNIIESRTRIATLEKAAAELATSLAEQTQILAVAKAELAAAYASKFWRLRNLWFRIKARVRRFRRR